MRPRNRPLRSQPIHTQLMDSLLSQLHSPDTKAFMNNPRRNTLIRAVATVTGDIAVAIAMANAAAWIIQSAALGVFLAFLVWLLAAIASLALSQYVVHPTIKVALSDRKLDMAVAATSQLSERFTAWARQAIPVAAAA